MLARPLALLALIALAVPGAARADTAGELRTELAGITQRTASQWASMLTPSGVFGNPFAADLARGHGSFVPPSLAYAVHRVGVRTGDPTLIDAAERAWPNAVDPARASGFDMLGAAYAYRTLPLSDGRRAQLGGYLTRYGVPLNGAVCISRPGCYNNLKLVDAVAVLAITGAGLAAADPVARLADPVAARAAAAAIVNERIGEVVDHGMRGRVGRMPLRASVLSDPPSDPTAYHALSAFMLGEAVRELGTSASAPARRARRETLDALALLLAPDGDASYLGRGQAQTWVPALAAAALMAGARDAASGALATGAGAAGRAGPPRATGRRGGADPLRAGRYLAGARAALRRLESLHATADRGFELVPGARTRATVAGIDEYAHTVAYNGLALLGLSVGLDALDAVPPATAVGRLVGAQKLAVADPDASGLGIVGDGRAWLAVHRTPTNRDDLRHDFGLLALKLRTGAAWTDLLAPRPLTDATADSGGPALIRRGRPITPVGSGLRIRGGEATITGGYRSGRRWLRRTTFRWRLTAGGARFTLTGARPGDRFRLLAFTPAGTGTAARATGTTRTLEAAGARWRFSRPVALRRLTGFHSGPVEDLDALEARLTAPRSGRFSVAIGAGRKVG